MAKEDTIETTLNLYTSSYSNKTGLLTILLEGMFEGLVTEDNIISCFKKLTYPVDFIEYAIEKITKPMKWHGEITKELINRTTLPSKCLPFIAKSAEYNENKEEILKLAESKKKKDLAKLFQEYPR